MGTASTKPPISVLNSTPLKARTLPTLVSLGCHSEVATTIVETVAGGNPMPETKYLIMNILA